MIDPIQVCVNHLRRMQRQIYLIMGRGRTTTEVDDSGLIRTVQINLGNNQIKDNVSVMQQYGFASNYPPATDVVVGFIAGDRSNGCVIASNNQNYTVRDLGNGAVALYDMFGNIIELNSAGIELADFSGNNIIMSAAGITIDTPETLNLTGKIVVIHANQTLKYDADGNGPVYTATTRTDYVIGSTGSSQPLNPPQIP